MCSRVTAKNIDTLVDLYLLTGNETYLTPIPRAVDWLNESRIGQNLWARFYEIGTNRPIYCDRGRKITYNLSDLSDERRYGYSWQGSWPSRSIERYEDVISTGREAYLEHLERQMTPSEKASKAKAMEGQVESILGSLDGEGRWIQDGWMYSKTFYRNVETLAKYLNYSGWNGGTLAPAIRSYTISVLDDGLRIRVNISRSNSSRIRRVLLRWTPPNDLTETELFDDGQGPDTAPDNGEYACVVNSSHNEWRQIFQGVLVAEDQNGHWNLSVLPLGMCDAIRDLYGQVNGSLQEARGLGVDTGQLYHRLIGLYLSMQNVGSDQDAEGIYAELRNMSQAVDRLVLTGLIDKARGLVDEAKRRGIDVCRDELFLQIAVQKFEAGNYVSARQFLSLPLKLEEQLDEGRFLALVAILSLALGLSFTKATSRSC